jgi:hypothetical protein
MSGICTSRRPKPTPRRMSRSVCWRAPSPCPPRAGSAPPSPAPLPACGEGGAGGGVPTSCACSSPPRRSASGRVVLGSALTLPHRCATAGAKMWYTSAVWGGSGAAAAAPRQPSRPLLARGEGQRVRDEATALRRQALSSALALALPWAAPSLRLRARLRAAAHGPSGCGSRSCGLRLNTTVVLPFGSAPQTGWGRIEVATRFSVVGCARGLHPRATVSSPPRLRGGDRGRGRRRAIRSHACGRGMSYPGWTPGEGAAKEWHSHIWAGCTIQALTAPGIPCASQC